MVSEQHLKHGQIQMGGGGGGGAGHPDPQLENHKLLYVSYCFSSEVCMALCEIC